MATIREKITETEWQLLANVGSALRDLRIGSGLNQRQAAAAFGTSQARVSPLEHGQSDIYLTTISRWANLYGYEVEINFVPIEDEFDKVLREHLEEEERG